MTEQAIDGKFAITNPVILAHPHLFEAVAYKSNGKEKGEPKFGGNLIITPGPELDALKAKAAAVAKAKWPTRALGDLKFPFASGDKLADKRKAKSGKDDGAYQRGKVVINAKSKYRPRLAIVANGRIVDLEDEAAIAQHKSKFFFGAEVLAEVNFVAYENPEKDGVTAYLNLVLATGKGTRIAGGASASEVFKGYQGSVSAEDPTAGAVELDDEIPF